ncbi:MAG: penicillin acylase family protein [Magnetospirillum sp.]|nr:penicillin acylase family protein [Magnetospirillum sp.]
METILHEEPSRSAAPPPRPEHSDAIGTQMSRRAKLVSSVALFSLLGMALAFLWLMSSLPRIEGRLPVKGLELPATVARDAHGIPRITARSIRDAYFVLGWVHAQDRMWQMELQRRIAAGRLAEIVGEKGLPNDRFMRTLGLYRLAEAGVAKLDKQTGDALQAYADGVNAWIDANRNRLPLEFMLLGFRPEPWRPADTLAWGRLMAIQLVGNWQDDVLRGKLAGELSAEQLGDLFPGYAADQPVTLSAGTAAGLLAALPPTAEPYLASNVWVVDGRHTASGKPLLANDPHLPFRAPILWYLVSIEAPGLTVSGATVPGVPFHLAGHNRRIAWGVTTTHADTVDLFVEKVSPDGAGYLTPAGRSPFVTRREVIKVKGGADVVMTVRQTRHGPVISDLAAQGLAGPGEVVALRSTALETDDLTAQAMMHLQRAVNWRSFLDALKTFDSPVQNFAFADTAGDIGFVTAGRVPLRTSGDGATPARGWTGEGDWQGWIPFDRLPMTYAPDSGVIVNSNNRVTPAGYPYTITAEWPDGYRAKRIGQMLAGRTALTPADMAAMQLDTLSLAALDIKPLLADVHPSSPLARQAAAMIAAWDGHMDRNRPEPLIFNAWMRQAWADVLSRPLGNDFRAFGPLRPAVLMAILTRHHHWCENAAPSRPSCDDLLAGSLETAVAGLADRHGTDPRAWKWGDEHHAVFGHPVLDHVPLLSRLAHLEIPTDGDDFTVNRGTFAGEGFDHVHGAGLRAVYDLSSPMDSRFIIATGQSGNILSRHYSDLLKRWRANRAIAIDSAPGETAILELEPEY